MEYYASTFIFASVIAVFVVAGLMSAYKTAYYLITGKSTNRTANQILAWVFSYVAVVLCWWAIDIPSEFRQTFLYVFPVYVLQKCVDMNMIKKIINGFLRKRGLLKEDDA